VKTPAVVAAIGVALGAGGYEIWQIRQDLAETNRLAHVVDGATVTLDRDRRRLEDQLRALRAQVAGLQLIQDFKPDR
jgi:uncharacterized protein HemX